MVIPNRYCVVQILVNSVYFSILGLSAAMLGSARNAARPKHVIEKEIEIFCYKITSAIHTNFYCEALSEPPIFKYTNYQPVLH